MRQNSILRRILGLLLAVSLLCTACAGNKAASMQLMKTEGNVGIVNGDGEEVSAKQALKLYSGYELTTARRSYAWINLDSVKLTKMDASSEIEIRKRGKDLEIMVNAGKLYFNVKEPLGDDESLNIRTSTMSVGIRGTCGWVEVADERHLKAYILEGKVECRVSDPDSGKKETVSVSGGETAEMILTAAGEVEVTVEEFTESDIIPFVLKELQQDEELCDKILKESGLDIMSLPRIDGPGSMIDQAAAELERMMGRAAADTALDSRVKDTVRQGEKISLYGNPQAVDEDAALEWQESLVDNILSGKEALPDWMEAYASALMPRDAAESSPVDYMQIRMGSDINCYKPNIYIYGEEGTAFAFSFAEPSLLTKTLPAYDGAWDVEIGADGRLTVDGKQGYDFLFYESRTIPGIFQTQTGFLVKAEDRAGRFEEILRAYGLNDQEIHDFIEFWDEMLDKDKDYLMYPQDTELVDGAMPVVIDGVQMDHYFRLWFCFREAGNTSAAEPALPEIVPAGHERTALVEWGGMILP